MYQCGNVSPFLFNSKCNKKGLFTVPMYSKCNHFHFCKVLSFLLNFLLVTHYSFFSWQFVTTSSTWILKQQQKKSFGIGWRFFSVVRNDNFNASLYVQSAERGKKQNFEGTSPLHPTYQLPYSHPSRSHPRQPFLLIFPLVTKALSSSQVYKQHDMLYFRNTLSPSTKGTLEQEHKKSRIQTHVFSSFGFLSPHCMIPRGPLTDTFISTPKAVFLACSLSLQLQMSG